MEREDIDLLLDTSHRWFKANHPLEKRTAAFRSGHHEGEAAWHAMAEMGWTGLTVPEEAGGFSASNAACFELIRQAGSDARPEPLELHLLLAPLVIAALPAHAPALIGGTMRLALAEVANGDGAVRLDKNAALEGRAGTVFGGEHATHLLVPVASDQAMRLVLVDLAADGVRRVAARMIDARAALQVEFHSTPGTQLSGEGIAQRALDRAAAALVADTAGVLQAAFDLTLDYLKQRHQFGKPLSTQQAVQHKMAEVFCDLQQLLALTGRVAKSFVGRRALRALGQLIQVSGGIAITEEYKLTHFYRRVHVAAALFGTAEAQLARIDVRAQLLVV
jgi:alkylation response protein AidB-like acyl-CoA dehydrogenase